MIKMEEQDEIKTDVALAGQTERCVMLKPCPHCGSSDFTGPHFVDYVGDSVCPSWWIECNSCPCGMEVEGDDINNLIAAWNKRAA